LVADCGPDSTEPPPPLTPGIQVVSGAPATDTIGATLSQALVVEVHDSTGKLAPTGTVVQFAGVQPGHLIVYEAEVRAPGMSIFAPLATATTDANGRVGVEVRLGHVAGPARVAVSVLTLGVSDTIAYTIVPGAAYDVTIAPLDTTIYVGQSYTMRGGVIDRGRNLRPDPLTWTTSGSGLSVTSTGVVTATAYGRYSVVATRTSTNAMGVVVSVPPQVRLAGCLDTRVIGVDINGTNLRDLRPFVAPGDCGTPRWIPGRNVLVYTHRDFGVPSVYVTDESRAARPFLIDPPLTLTLHGEAAPSANGEWVYFGGFDSRCSLAHFCLFRSRADGTAAEWLGSDAMFPNGISEPAPSPDGTRVAVVSLEDDVPVIRVFDVATQTVSSWSVPGRYPAWSPTGTHIAFMPNGTGPIRLMNPDGSGIRNLTSGGFEEEHLAWSADGRWLVRRASSYGVILVDVTIGTVMSVGLLDGAMTAPSFRQ
jgi:hypothetical protein